MIRKVWFETRGTQTFITSVTTFVFAVANQQLIHAPFVATLKHVAGARSITTRWLVTTVVAVFKPVAIMVLRYTLAITTGMLIWGTQCGTVDLVTAVPALHVSIAL